MDRFKGKEEMTSWLKDRYGIARSTCLNRVRYLEIKADFDQDGYYLSDPQVEELDKLNEWLKAGSRMADFPKRGVLVLQNSEVVSVNEEINFEDLEGDQDYAFAQLIRTAQEQAAGITIAKNLLTAQFLGNPAQLPEDLREQVERSQVAIAPKSRNPLTIAGEMIKKAKQSVA